MHTNCVPTGNDALMYSPRSYLRGPVSSVLTRSHILCHSVGPMLVWSIGREQRCGKNIKPEKYTDTNMHTDAHSAAHRHTHTDTHTQTHTHIMQRERERERDATLLDYGVYSGIRKQLRNLRYDLRGTQHHGDPQSE